jgi:hypothetical protein
MKCFYYDVFSKKGYKFGYVITNGFEDPLEKARQEYGNNVDYLIEWERENHGTVSQSL